MITAQLMRAARALVGIDQQTLANLAGVSLPTIQRMAASTGNVRGVVDTLMQVAAAFDKAGIELIGEGSQSTGIGRGVRFKRKAPTRQQHHEGRRSAPAGRGGEAMTGQVRLRQVIGLPVGSRWDRGGTQ